MVSKKDTVVCIVGLGYVGLPLAVEFAKNGIRVIGFDVNKKRIQGLKSGEDLAKEFSKKELLNRNITYTSDKEYVGKANFIVVCVPTPVRNKKPDLGYLENASKIVGENMKGGTIVVYESTVYPGVTEDFCTSILEKYSGMKCGKNFRIGYSPERINPGDREHTVDKIIKVVAGMDRKTTDDIAKVYGWIVKAGIYKAENIKTAEAAKIIENIQRDLNIALMNELSLIFDKMDINTLDVIETAGTKWNFHKYYPGLVGGHCIPLDPYYLVHKAKQLGYHPKVILSGRAINDSMAKYVANKMVQLLNDANKQVRGSKVLLMGLTFKENVPDLRTTPAKVVVSELKKRGVKVMGYDPLIRDSEIRSFFKIKPVKSLDKIKVDGIIISVIHAKFKGVTLNKLKAIMRSKPILIDVKGFFSPSRAEKLGFLYKQL